MVYVVNPVGRVVEVSEDEAEQYVFSRGFRLAEDSEIAGYMADRERMNRQSEGANTVYFQTVKATPDGYGMSRGHMTTELAKRNVMLSENYTDQKVGVLYNYPYGILSMRSTVRLIYTMWESDKIPEEWPDYLAMADEVLVPSKWCQDVFAKSGIPSTVVPLGYNDDTFKYFERDLAIENNRPFTFIHYDSFNVRKGWGEVFQAFTEEFGNDPSVRLVLKTAQNAVRIPILKSVYPNIDTVLGTLPESELRDLLHSADCMVYPSRGEGFGITPLEAMATGLPTIVPNEHGISEYFNSNYMIEVKATARCPALYSPSRFKDQNLGEMAVADIVDLRQKMRYAYNNQAQVKELGKAASEYVKRYTYKHTAYMLAEIINKWQDAEVIKRGDSKFLQVEEV